jgi:negative regulator of flagellin synthesis FlgM
LPTVKAVKLKTIVVHSMKINSSLPSPAAPLKARNAAPSNTAATPAPSAAGDASVSSHLKQTPALGAAAAPFDSQRVSEIRQAITEGHFKIDAEKIASRLIDDVRDQLAKDRPIP